MTTITNYRPDPADVTRVQVALGLDYMQARNHVISRELALQAIQRKHHERLQACIDRWARPERDGTL